MANNTQETVIQIPGVGEITFPAHMSDAEIEAAIKNNILPQAEQGATAGKSAESGPWTKYQTRRYRVTAPDGRQFNVTAPGRATRDEIIERVQSERPADGPWTRYQRSTTQSGEGHWTKYQQANGQVPAPPPGFVVEPPDLPPKPPPGFKMETRGMKIGDIRRNFPQYGDMSDLELARAIHARYYSDLDFDDFAKRIELSPGVIGTRVGRQVGLAGRYLVEGATALPGVVNDAVLGVANKGFEMAGSDFRFMPTSQAVSEQLSRAGLPEPRATGERVVGDASRALSAVGGVAGIAQRVAGPVAKTLAQAPKAQATGAVAGGTAMGVTREGGGGPGAQFAAGMTAGVLAPAAMAATVSRWAAPNVQLFKSVGAEPSVGNTLNSPFVQGLENLLARLPGGQGLAARFRENTQRRLGDRTKTGTTAEAAGRTIERGISGPGGFIERTKETYKRLDAITASKMPKDSTWLASNTMSVLDDLVTPVAGAERTTRALVNPTLATMRQNLADDLAANNGRLPYEALRQLRTQVGSMIDDALVTGVPGGQLKQVYAALSRDMERAAKTAGVGPHFTRQNNYYRARMERIESVLERVIGKGRQPEDIFKVVNPTNQDAVGKLRATLRSLKPDERQVVARAVIERLGRATPGRQNDVGDVFSSETFLTNWNRISEAAKNTLFQNPQQKRELDKIANIANRLRKSGQVAANPSGTAGSAASYGIFGSPLVAVATNSISPVLIAGGALALTNIGSRMLTSPRVVNWLASGAITKPDQLAPYISRLAVIYAETDDPALRREIENYVDAQGVALERAGSQ